MVGIFESVRTAILLARISIATGSSSLIILVIEVEVAALVVPVTPEFVFFKR